MTAHESFKRDQDVEGSTDRGFGRTMGGVCALLAVVFYLRHRPYWVWALPLSVVFLVAAETLPGALAPLNRLWTKLSFVLQKITNPIVLGVLFFGVVTPAALMLKLLGKDVLGLRARPDSRSYWIDRGAERRPQESMRRLF